MKRHSTPLVSQLELPSGFTTTITQSTTRWGQNGMPGELLPMHRSRHITHKSILLMATVILSALASIDV